MEERGNIWYGESMLYFRQKKAEGSMIELDGEKYYRISNYDAMGPFFMSIVSPSDHWMFVSSLGGLTCGRKDAGNALFPYYTDDKIHDSFSTTGPKTLVLAEKEGKSFRWEPFRTELPAVYKTTRNLYKNAAGNKLIFEEINHSLELSFSYAWMNSERFGFVRQSRLENLSEKPSKLSIVDGIRNILPYGVDQQLQSTMSTLVDGYKKCELQPGSGLGIYTLSSILTDMAEPSEALKATTVWSAGVQNARYLLSEDQLKPLIPGTRPESETSLKGRRGAYFVSAGLELSTKGSADWLIVADINQGPSDVPATRNLLEQHNSPEKSRQLIATVLEDVNRGTADLNTLVSMADGAQCTAEEITTIRHSYNTLFNIMRGGIFPDNYQVNRADLKEFIGKWNKHSLKKHEAFLGNLPETLGHEELRERARDTADPDLIRLVCEYLPLTFSRRHGDPSRPWNRFSIDVKKPDGSRKLYFEGNWRDIFQNWEALALSYPGFIGSFISKFVNASTADGYNPYRITKDGIDWEVPDPDDPWGNIGYWGDHQVIYLLKFIELSQKYHPGEISRLLGEKLFSYANVPYRIKAYEDLVNDPHNSIDFDDELEALIAGRVEKTGSDGRLLQNAEGKVLLVSLSEKLLALLLSKLSNFVPGGGIWMNTQRPEWNDANNALAGYGLSMVTLYYLRRFISVTRELFQPAGETKQAVSRYEISQELGTLFRQIRDTFNTHKDLLKSGINDQQRRRITDQLGMAGEQFRDSVYRQGFPESTEALENSEILEFLHLSLQFVDHSIESNRRSDGLFHSYNLVGFSEDSCSVSYLYEMLEGQVAVLSSGYLSASERLGVLDSLRESKMYREDQGSYTLYPDRELPGFLEKNVLPLAELSQSGFLAGELNSGSTRIVEKDLSGNGHFNGSFRNAAELRKSLDRIEGLTENEKDLICRIFEESFNHRQFTGRSGTFFKYEGLGSIYWHMVSKLLLAVQEACLHTDDPDIFGKLAEHYREIKKGLGAHKSPELYGAFPVDPYSHTPGFSGVQQPGMTGQVKEDFITRYGELGVRIENGCIRFRPTLLSQGEFLHGDRQWNLHNRDISLKKGELGFTICGTPVIYRLAGKRKILVEMTDGSKTELPSSDVLDLKSSHSVFNRDASIKTIRVEVIL